MNAAKAIKNLIYSSIGILRGKGYDRSCGLTRNALQGHRISVSKASTQKHIRSGRHRKYPVEASPF